MDDSLTAPGQIREILRQTLVDTGQGGGELDLIAALDAAAAINEE